MQQAFRRSGKYIMKVASMLAMFDALKSAFEQLKRCCCFLFYLVLTTFISDQKVDLLVGCLPVLSRSMRLSETGNYPTQISNYKENYLYKRMQRDRGFELTTRAMDIIMLTRLTKLQLISF